MAAKPTLDHASITATTTAPLDPATLEFYRQLACEAQELVTAALGLRDRLNALDRQTELLHPMKTDDAAYGLKVLSGSELAWSVLSDGLMAVIYG